MKNHHIKFLIYALFILSLPESVFADEILAPRNASNFDVQFGHFDDDGRGDLFVRNISSGDVFIHRNNGSKFSFYSDQKISSITVPSTQDWEFLVADINGDGFDDIINRSVTSGEMWVHFNKGSGFESAGSRLATTPGGNDWKSYLAYLDGDNRADLCNVHVSSGNVWCHNNLGSMQNNSWFDPGSFLFNEGVAALQHGPNWSVHFADMNGDGRDDLINRAKESNQIFVHYFQSTSNVFEGFASSVDHGPFKVYEHEVQFFQMDNSGPADLISHDLRAGDIVAFPISFDYNTISIASLGAVRGYSPPYSQAARRETTLESPPRSIDAIAWYDTDHFTSREPGFNDSRPDGDGGWWSLNPNHPNDVPSTSSLWRTATPKLGLYDSRNVSVIRQHAYLMRAAGISAVVVDLSNVARIGGGGVAYSQAVLDQLNLMYSVYRDIKEFVPPKIMTAIRVNACGVNSVPNCVSAVGDTSNATDVATAVLDIINSHPENIRLSFKFNDGSHRKDLPMMMVFHEDTDSWKSGAQWDDVRFNVRYSGSQYGGDVNYVTPVDHGWMHYVDGRRYWNFHESMEHQSNPLGTPLGTFSNYRAVVNRLEVDKDIVEQTAVWMGLYQSNNKRWDPMLYAPNGRTTFQRQMNAGTARGIPRVISVNRFNYSIGSSDEAAEGLSLTGGSSFEPLIESDLGWSVYYEVADGLFKQFGKHHITVPGKPIVSSIVCPQGGGGCDINFSSSRFPTEYRLYSSNGSPIGPWEMIEVNGRNGTVSSSLLGQHIRLVTKNAFGISVPTDFEVKLR